MLTCTHQNALTIEAAQEVKVFGFKKSTFAPGHEVATMNFPRSTVYIHRWCPDCGSIEFSTTEDAQKRFRHPKGLSA